MAGRTRASATPVRSGRRAGCSTTPRPGDPAQRSPRRGPVRDPLPVFAIFGGASKLSAQTGMLEAALPTAVRSFCRTSATRFWWRPPNRRTPSYATGCCSARRRTRCGRPARWAGSCSWCRRWSGTSTRPWAPRRHSAGRGHEVAWAGHPELVRALVGSDAVVFPAPSPRRDSPGLLTEGLAAFQFLWSFLVPLADAMAGGGGDRGVRPRCRRLRPAGGGGCAGRRAPRARLGDLGHHLRRTRRPAGRGRRGSRRGWTGGRPGCGTGSATGRLGGPPPARTASWRTPPVRCSARSNCPTRSGWCGPVQSPTAPRAATTSPGTGWTRRRCPPSWSVSARPTTTPGPVS